MSIDAASWYEREIRDDSLYQGDVVGDVPIILMPPAGDGPWMVLRPSPPHTLEQVLAGQTPRAFKPHPESSRPDAWRLGVDLVLAKGFRKSVMIVTQSCDIVNRNWIQVAPIFEVAKIDDPNKRDSLTNNDIGYMFFLPSAPPALVEDSFADLSMIASVHKSYLRRASPSLHLTGATRALFQRHLANLHGRLFTFTRRDTVPETGEYLCQRCFLNRGEISRVENHQDEIFAPCPKCGDDVLWVLQAVDIPGG